MCLPLGYQEDVSAASDTEGSAGLAYILTTLRQVATVPMRQVATRPRYMFGPVKACLNTRIRLHGVIGGEYIDNSPNKKIKQDV